jgi:hypothetical protein
MFIAVINEIFDIAEEAKRSQQVGQYFRSTQGPDKTLGPWIHRFNPYRWVKLSPRAIIVENFPSNLVLPMQKALVQDFGLPTPERRPTCVCFLLEKMWSMFESLIISGIACILDAAMLAMLYMIPYAVWGLSIFAGLTNMCNDSNVLGMSDCING